MIRRLEHPFRIGAALALAFAGMAGTALAAGEMKPLGDCHIEAGLPCAACHQEQPPSQPVQSTTCLLCHGPHDKLVKRSASLQPNPHNWPAGAMTCDACHRAHPE